MTLPAGDGAGADRATGSAPPTGARPRPRTATMRDVAALAGVSLKTVSRVVNRESGVSTELVARVETAARHLHYRPNLGARSLRRADGMTATIGVALEDLANPFSAVLHRAVEDVARRRNVAVLAGSIDGTPDLERDLVGAFASRRVDGLIVMPAGGDHSHLAREMNAGMAMVFVDRAPGSLAGDVVLSDNRAGALHCVDHLIGAGHQQIAFLGDRRTVSTARDRHLGYLDAVQRAGLITRRGHVVHDLDTTEAAERATLELLDLDRPPTALFTAQNLVSIGALRALRARHAQHRIAMVGFDDFPLADLLEPAVTVLAQDPYEIGRRAAEQLFARLDGDTAPVGRHLVATRLVVRGSGEIPPPA